MNCNLTFISYKTRHIYIVIFDHDFVSKFVKQSTETREGTDHHNFVVTI